MKIQFSTLKKVETNRDKSAIHLEFDSPVIFDTAGTFTENRKANKQVKWQVEHITLKNPWSDPQNIRTKVWADELADQISEKLEVSLEEKEMQLSLYPKNHPLMGNARDPKRINAYLHEGNKELEIELEHQKAPSAFSWKIIEQTFDPATARQKASQRIKKTWKKSSSDKTVTGTINNKSITTVLGNNWENDFNNYDTKEDINQYESQLHSKITNELNNREIKIKFTVKEAKEALSHDNEYSSNNFISLKIQTDYLMSTLFPHLDLINGNHQDGPFSDITFIFDNQKVNSEVWNSLADSEGEEFQLNFNLSKIYFFIGGTWSPYEDKPKISMWAGGKRLEVFFKHADALNVISIQKTGENPENDDTPKLDELTNLLDAAISPNSNEQDKVAALKKAGEFEGFISPENQAKITQINQQFANNPTQIRQALSEKIENQLTANHLTINDLLTEDKALYNDLKSTSLVQTAQIYQTAEKKLTHAIGTAGAKKVLDNLETQIQKILSSTDLDEKKRLQKELRKFIKSKNTFHQAEKQRAQNLSQQLKKSIQENDFNQNSETPWEKIILVSCIGIGLTLIILLAYNLTKNSRRR